MMLHRNEQVQMMYFIQHFKKKERKDKEQSENKPELGVVLLIWEAHIHGKQISPFCLVNTPKAKVNSPARYKMYLNIL